MSYEFHNFCLDNGGPCRWVFYVAGMPWAATTGPLDLTEDEKQLMFGYQLTQENGNAKAALSVQILEGFLDSNGLPTISISSNETDSTISGGRWSVKIADVEPGVTWPHVQGSREIRGIEGLTTLPDPRIDTQIHSARLQATMTKSATGIKIFCDYGDRLYDIIEDNEDQSIPTYIWIGKEVIATASAPVSTGDNMFSLATIDRGIWDTRPCTHEVQPDNPVAVSLADAPVGGITGRPAYLFCIPINEATNAPIDAGEIGKVHHGRVSSKITIEDGLYTVDCEPWWAYLNQKVSYPVVSGELYGYSFSRGHDDSAGPPTRDHALGASGDGEAGHMIIWEWQASAWTRKVVWLCAEDSTVHFATRPHIRLALAAEIAAMSAGAGVYSSDTLVYDYHLSSTALKHDDNGAPTGAHSSYTGGILPWILNFNLPSFEHHETLKTLISKFDSFFLRPAMTFPSSAWSLRRCQYHDGLWYHAGTGAEDEGFLAGAVTPYKARYFYQYDWSDASGHQGFAINGEKLDEWPVSGDNDDAAELYLQSYYCPVSDFDGMGEVWIGAEDRFVNGKPTLCSMALKDVDEVENLLEASDTISTTFLNYDGGLIKQNPDIAPSPFFYCGFCLFYIPELHDEPCGGDPFRVTMAAHVQATSVSDLFRRLLGDLTTETVLPPRYTFDAIPDAVEYDVGLNTEQYATIDWDSLDELTTPKLPDEYVALRFDAKINPWKMLKSICQYHAIVMRWEWDASVKQHVIRFRHMGLVLASTAQSEGRSLNGATRKHQSIATGQHSAAPLVNRVSAKFGYIGSSTKAAIEINVSSSEATSATGGRDVTMNIQDKLTHIQGWTGTSAQIKTAAEYFSNAHLARLMWSMPTQSVESTISGVIKHPVGGSVLVTDPNARQPYDGSYGLVSQPALVTKMSVDWAKMKVNVEYRISPAGHYDIAPSLRITSSTVDDNDNVTADTTAAQEYQANSGRTDLSYFANVSYNASTDEYVVEDSTDYRVTVFSDEENPTVYEDVVISNLNLTAGSAKLTKTGMGITWDDGVDHIVIYGDWDNANLHSAQRNWLYHAQYDGLLDTGSVEIPGRRWI
ncbi:MAG: hypothetical protein GY832_23685 [Chloroflexi bacterium]|nr:hypothetical protein [Chloroflexota bacterium]